MNEADNIPVTRIEAEKQIATVVATVRKAMAELDARKMVNLGEQGLQPQVDTLCGIYERLDMQDAQLLRPRLNSLMAALDDLSTRLKTARDEVGTQLNQSTQTQAAHRAYATSQVQGDTPQAGTAAPSPAVKKDDDHG